MSSDKIYPCLVQVCSVVHSEIHGPCQEISNDFSKTSGMGSTVRYHNGHVEARNDLIGYWHVSLRLCC